MLFDSHTHLNNENYTDADRQVLMVEIEGSDAVSYTHLDVYKRQGSERALLLDTGLGIVPVKPLIEELYQGELITVNSHFHFDHIGNNHSFEPVYGYIDACASKVAAAGLRRADVGDQMCIRDSLPAGPYERGGL